MKILVIDDEKPTLSMFKLFLAAYGYEVFTAEDGEKGLEIFNQIKPDIVFTDIKMPGIDGLEVLRRIRQSSIDSQVIIITGHGDMEKAIEALDLDASDFINKPVERAALNSALARAEKRKQLSGHIPFGITNQRVHTAFEIKAHGKLTKTDRPLLMSPITDTEQLADIKQIHFVLEDSFSIDRAGITILTEMIQQCIQMGIQIVIKNISYNYARVFQMAGIDKIATLEEAQTPE